ncbi:acyl carrier protein [Nocardia sp. BSTN01]|uniref:acyl carrier protein n=1 Tax=Nocardia sp. BSTN01 TaxID=2783665 RepID=UPI001890B5BA|nr:acyl carrier protein [Nocardia sp. BSTN01]MBF4999576.1 acyl carrier protein [Nocardia sp. BSTN01]
MSDITIDGELRAEIAEIVARILEVDVADVTWDGDFRDEHDADSLQGIEILSALERGFAITIDQERLPDIVTLSRTYAVVAEAQRAVGDNGC